MNKYKKKSINANNEKDNGRLGKRKLNVNTKIYVNKRKKTLKKEREITISKVT